MQIDSSSPMGKSILSLLKSAKETVTITPLRTKETADAEQHSPLYYELQSAFRDVKLMVDGKKRKKTLDELIDELRNNND
jgi:hypothetical protein